MLPVPPVALFVVSPEVGGVVVFVFAALSAPSAAVAVPPAVVPSAFFASSG